MGLSEALLQALERQQPSAVYCAGHVQSLCVEHAINKRLMAEVDEGSQPASPSRLLSCIRALRQRSTQL